MQTWKGALCLGCRHQPVALARASARVDIARNSRAGQYQMGSSAPKVQDGAWRDAPVAERADAPVAAAASAGPSYVVTIQDDDKEEAKQRTKGEQGKKTSCCCLLRLCL